MKKIIQEGESQNIHTIHVLIYAHDLIDTPRDISA